MALGGVPDGLSIRVIQRHLRANWIIMHTQKGAHGAPLVIQLKGGATWGFYQRGADGALLIPQAQAGCFCPCGTLGRNIALYRSLRAKVMARVVIVSVAKNPLWCCARRRAVQPLKPLALSLKPATACRRFLHIARNDHLPVSLIRENQY